MISFENAPGLLEKARLLPLCPGIYIMHGASGEVIYVGKSKALKNRVMSYFQNPAKHNVKTMRLVSQIKDFECIFTNSESEALILENELIKLHKPRYNIKLKDDKNYPYVRLSLSEPYPRLSTVRRRGADRDRYFGPYSSTNVTRTLIDAANSLFGLPNCKRQFPRDIGKARPCLYYHMGRCVGVCTGKVSREQYAGIIDNVIPFLREDHKEVTQRLTAEMREASDRLDFERAAKLRDSLRAISDITARQQIVRDPDFEADVFGLYSDDISSSVCQMSVRGGRLIDRTVYHFSADEILTPESFTSVTAALYASKDSIPPLILFDERLFDTDDAACRELLTGRAGHAVRLAVPERGDMKRLVELAGENARESVMHRRAVMEKNDSVLEELSELLGLESPPKRIESIDISNSGDSQIVAGIICVVDGKFSKKDYRSFNIDAAHRDDVGSMEEAYTRRFARALKGDGSFAELPDLILADGAAGQVNAVKNALVKSGLDIPVFGMVKDSFHKTRCLTDGEKEISIAKNQAVFGFIYRIQEEVHRYAFSRMDTRRLKTVRGSTLEKIPGIGEAKAKILIKTFKSVKAVSLATEEELSAVKGISSSDAKRIFKHFHEEK